MFNTAISPLWTVQSDVISPSSTNFLYICLSQLLKNTGLYKHLTNNFNVMLKTEVNNRKHSKLSKQEIILRLNNS
jgi:ribosome-associated protein YbcJ (S4-like RNA binding protein)